MAGIALLALNLWGLAAPNDQRDIFPAIDLLPYTDALANLRDIHAETPEGIVRQATMIVHRAMSGQWPPEPARVPARQNWILWLAGFFDQAAVSCGLTNVDDLFSVYQMTDHDRALQRGFGICSQQALVLAGFLDELHGYKSEVAVLSGHAVLQVTLPGGSLMLADPHKGVVLPFGLKHAETRPGDVEALYPPGSDIPRLYGPAGNQLAPAPARAYNPKLYLLEKTSYLLIWLVPGALMLPCLVSRIRR